MQTAVFNVILIASKLDSQLVIKKAKNARLSQRTPDLCDKILYEVQGFELLPDEKWFFFNLIWYLHFVPKSHFFSTNSSWVQKKKINLIFPLGESDVSLH